MRILTRLLSLGVAALIGTSAFAASSYPDRPLNWVVPWPAGGITDTSARTLSEPLSKELGQTVVIDNKPGGSGIIGAEAVVSAKPDGYSFLYASAGALLTYPLLGQKMSFDPQTDLVPVHGVAQTPMILVVNADSPFKTLDDLIAYAKENPGKLNFSSFGAGSSNHLILEMFLHGAGIQMTHIPYKGAAPAQIDLLAGVIDVSLDFFTTQRGYIHSGKIRALAVTSAERQKDMPEVPTFAEKGLKDLVISSWSAIYVPKATPQDVIDKLSGAVHDALQAPAVKKYYADQGAMTLDDMDGPKLKAFVDDQRQKFATIIKDADIKLEQ